MDEMREMTMSQFMVYADLTAGDASAEPEAFQQEEDAPKVRKATQADIESFFSI